MEMIRFRRMLTLVMIITGLFSFSTTGVATGTPALKDVLIIAANREPVSMDPADVTVSYAELVESNIYDTLLKLDKNLDIVPELAEAYEQVDELTWKFTLRKDVKFSNGDVMTSKDVLFSFARLYDLPPGNTAVKYIDPDGYETPDDYTFILRTVQPYVFLPSKVAENTLSILSERAVIEAGDQYGRNPIGTGPYKFVSWTAGDSIIVERNDLYWGEPAKTKTIVFKMITENSTRTINLESGDVDLVIDIQESDADRIANGETTTLVAGPGSTARYLAFNCGHDVFNDKKVRQAMVHATDLELIREVIYPSATPQDWTVIAPSLKGRVSGLQPYDYNPELAKQMLKEAGLEEGFTVYYIYLANTVNNMLSEIVQAMWQEVGVTLELHPMESGALSTAMNKGEQDFCLAGTSIPSFQTGQGLYDFFHSSSIGSTFNRSYLNNPALDEKIDLLLGEFNEEKRNELGIEVQRMVHEEAPLMVIGYTNHLIGMKKTVEGFEFTPTQRYELEKVTITE